MKKIFLFLFAVIMLLFVVAADWPGIVVPEWVVPLLTVLLLPALVEVVKAIAIKLDQAWLTGKAALSILAFLLAVIISALFTQWGTLPPLPNDPMQAVSAIIGYASAFFAASTGLYNVIYDGLLDRIAKPRNVLSYRL